MFFIESSRLKLIPLTAEHLNLFDKPTELTKILDLNAYHLEQEPIYQQAFNDALTNFWLPQVALNPENYTWFTNWAIILKDKNIAIGGIGLSGLPDENGETETGYGIDLNNRGKGYASEALICLRDWTFENPNMKTLIAHTMIDGLASQKVLKNAHFELLGQVTTEDGDVLKWKYDRK